jgi:hypothetical protein
MGPEGTSNSISAISQINPMALTAAAELGSARMYFAILLTKIGNVLCFRCPSLFATSYAAFFVEVEDFVVNIVSGCFLS